MATQPPTRGTNTLDRNLMNTFLLIDTATPVCSVALASGGRILYSRSEGAPEGGHAARAGVLVEEALQVAREQGLELKAIGLSAGPGSYTGLRIGSSLAKGLCHGFGIPLIAISTLEAMALGFIKTIGGISEGEILAPMIDARRQEVYTALFDCKGQRLVEDCARIVSGEIVFENHLGESDDSQVFHFFGNGVAKPEGLSRGAQVVHQDFEHRAEYLLESVERAFERGDFVDVAYWTPNYLKEYVATIAKNKVLGQ